MVNTGWFFRMAIVSSFCCATMVFSQDSLAQPVLASGEVTFKTVHIFNLKSNIRESDLTTILAEFNELFVRLGHPESQYRLWKLAPGEKTKQVYLWESNWQSKDVYDQIHGNEEFKKLLKDKFLKIAEMLCDHIYSKYHNTPIENKKE